MHHLMNRASIPATAQDYSKSTFHTALHKQQRQLFFSPGSQWRLVTAWAQLRGLDRGQILTAGGDRISSSGRLVSVIVSGYVRTHTCTNAHTTCSGGIYALMKTGWNWIHSMKEYEFTRKVIIFIDQ